MIGVRRRKRYAVVGAAVHAIRVVAKAWTSMIRTLFRHVGRAAADTNFANEFTRFVFGDVGCA